MCSICLTNPAETGADGEKFRVFKEVTHKRRNMFVTTTQNKNR